jgi:sialate O-acetylesterase
MEDDMFKAAPIFSDNMVLQRGKDVPVWGEGKDGTVITLSLGTLHLSTVVRNGAWKLVLPPQSAGLRGVMEIAGGGTRIRFENVIFGDVWFAGGQSNMELALRDCRNGRAELAAARNPDIRFYQPVKRAVVDDDFLREEQNCCWQECRPDTAAALSAVAYFCARKLNADLNIPIGIINCSWGGTSVSAWMGEAQLNKSAAGQRCIADYDVQIRGKSEAQYDAEMAEYNNRLSRYEQGVQALQAKDPDVSREVILRECGEYPWPLPTGTRSAFRPANLYRAMVRRVAPFALKGFLYYQGEADEDRAADYAELMGCLIDQWRTDWGDDSLPFLFVQLTMFISQKEIDAGLLNDHWPVLREQQYKVSRTVANTGLAVIIDCGEFDNIHPLDKQTVGFRLALQALKKVYGRSITADGPVFARAAREGASLRVCFHNAEYGLEARGALAGFELAGADGVYHPAEAVIEGSTVILSAAAVPEPAQARYGWVKYGPTPLYAKNGLPAMPFRSVRG